MWLSVPPLTRLKPRLVSAAASALLLDSTWWRCVCVWGGVWGGEGRGVAGAGLCRPENILACFIFLGGGVEPGHLLLVVDVLPPLHLPPAIKGQTLIYKTLRNPA